MSPTPNDLPMINEARPQAFFIVIGQPAELSSSFSWSQSGTIEAFSLPFPVTFFELRTQKDDFYCPGPHMLLLIDVESYLKDALLRSTAHRFSRLTNRVKVAVCHKWESPNDV